MVNIRVDESKCIGCGQCANVCPVQMYEIKGGKSKVKQENLKNCMECHACEVSCPQKAITID